MEGSRRTKGTRIPRRGSAFMRNYTCHEGTPYRGPGSRDHFLNLQTSTSLGCHVLPDFMLFTIFKSCLGQVNTHKNTLRSDIWQQKYTGPQILHLWHQYYTSVFSGILHALWKGNRQHGIRQLCRCCIADLLGVPRNLLHEYLNCDFYNQVGESHFHRLFVC